MQKSTILTPRIWHRPTRKLTPAKRKALMAKRDAWLGNIHPMYLFHRLFDMLPGVYFFAKNRRGEAMFASTVARKIYHLAEESDIIGLTDFDLNPEAMAQSQVDDDARIYATGQPLCNRVELWFDGQGVPDWFVVNKMPIYSRAGKIIGIMGFLQSYERRVKQLQQSHGIAKVVSQIRRDYTQNISIRDLAAAAGLSVRHLERKFKESFGVGPRQFLINTRLLAASQRLRETQEGLAEIAYACGFSDHSAFTRDFRRHFGVTPRDFRRREQTS